MATMRAWQYASRNEPFESNLKLETVPRLEAPSKSTTAKDRCVLVKVHATSLNPADYKVPLIPVIGAFIVKRPATPSIDFAGTIVSLPSSANRPDLQPGDRVLGRLDWVYQHGALAEYVLGQPNSIVKLPPTLNFVQGAALGTAGLSALQPLVMAGVGEGSRVFVNGGSGGVGSFSVQMAKLLGAAYVTATCGPDNVARVKELGADEVLNYRETDIIDSLKAAAKDKGTMYDAVIENVGAVDSLYESCHHFVRPGGYFLQVAGTNALFTFKRMVCPGFLGGGRRKYDSYLSWNDLAQLQKLTDWAGEGKLRIDIDSEYGFEEAREAFARLSGGRAKGKVVVRTVNE